MSMRLRVLVFVLIVLALTTRSARAAEPTTPADSTDSARTHFAAGVRLYDASSYTAALDEFRAAYAAKPSPGIKRNIALCLKGLKRYPEAIDALDEMLAEGQDSLSPAVREGAQRAIAEMGALVATVVVHVTSSGRAPAFAVATFVDEQPLSANRISRPIRLMPGDHVFTARASNCFDAQQRAKLSAGQTNVVIDLDLVAVQIVQHGRLAVRSNVATASIAIDGVAMNASTWSGELPVGPHHVEVSAMGYRTHAADVTITAAEPTDLAIDMTSMPARTPETPEIVEAPTVRVERDWYALVGLGFFGESLSFSTGLDDNGTRRGMSGLSLLGHLGRHLGTLFSAGLYGEVGAMGTDPYTSVVDTASRVRVTMTTWALAPELRVRSKGKVRALAGVALGLQGESVSAQLAAGTGSGSLRNEAPSGVSAMALIEGGGQVDAGRWLLEGMLFADAHGVGSVSGSGGSYFATSPVARGGLRLLVGYTF
jgi:hypothetical protein